MHQAPACHPRTPSHQCPSLGPRSHRTAGLGKALLLIVAAGCHDAQVAPSSLPSGGLQELLDRERAAVGAPGAILGLARGAMPATVVASGLADREQGTPMRPDTPYFLGSISKTYTAATVLRLAEEGRLSLDQPLSRTLPDFPRGAEITLRQLLAHTSGLKDFYTYLYYRPDREEMIELVTRDWSEPELLALAGRFGHWFEPGTDWDYSNTNYYLLGVVIERAAGVPLEQAYRRYLYQPLSLERTWLSWHEEPRGVLPVGYMGPLEGWKHSEMFGTLGPTSQLDRSPVEWGAGGIAAPAAEALRFLRGLLAGQLLAPSSLAEMTRFRDTPTLGMAETKPNPHAPPDGYGLGLVRMERAGHTVIGHGGLFTGHTAGLWHLPACDLTLALYFNRGFVNQREVLNRLLPALTQGCPAHPAPPHSRD